MVVFVLGVIGDISYPVICSSLASVNSIRAKALWCFELNLKSAVWRRFIRGKGMDGKYTVA